MQQLELFGKYDAMEYAVSLTTYEMYRLKGQDEILYYKVKELRRAAAIKRYCREAEKRTMYRRIQEQVRRATFIAKVDGAEFSRLPPR